jgi:aminoglycoside 3-N-acetyltransferase
MRDSEAIERISADAEACGVRRGGVLLVHSSLRSMGLVPGGAETVVRGLLSALGVGGTLLMPALSHRFVTRDQPVFDVARTPACVGAIPEHFRTRPGTRRSVHPTHSVAGTGPLAGDLLSDHDRDDTPCGPHSPFRRLPDAGGQILMLGCGTRPNTSLHAVEEIAEPPYLFGPHVDYRIVHPDGRTVTARHRRHGFAGYRQRYDRAVDLLEAPEVRTGRILEAAVHVIDAPAMWREALKALARDPCFFVEPSG